MDTESRRVPLDEMEDTLCAFEVGDGSLSQWTRPRWRQAPADRQGAPGPLCRGADAGASSGADPHPDPHGDSGTPGQPPRPRRLWWEGCMKAPPAARSPKPWRGGRSARLSWTLPSLQVRLRHLSEKARAQPKTAERSDKKAEGTRSRNVAEEDSPDARSLELRGDWAATGPSCYPTTAPLPAASGRRY